MQFPGRDSLFVAVFALQIVPIQVTMIPLLQLYVDPPFGLPAGGRRAAASTRLAVALDLRPAAGDLPAAQLHEGGPRRADRGGRVDGAGHVQIFTRIMLPLMTPAIAAFGIFQFLWVWNDLLVALVFGGGNPTSRR